MSEPRAIRLQEIADQAGVSRATVSLALRGHPGISKATRARIERIARELGYRPNPLISALMTHQRRAREPRPTHLTLALAINFRRTDPWTEYISPDLPATIVREAANLGYQVEEFWLGDLVVSGQRLTSILFERSVPGVIVAPLPEAQGSLDLDWTKFSAVAVGFSLQSPALHRISSHRFVGMRLAVERLRALGYRRIGLAMHANQDRRVHHQWSAAFLWEQQRAPEQDRVPLFIAGEDRWTEAEFAQWVRATRPDAVISYDAGVEPWLRRMPMRIPQDIGFAVLWAPNQTGQYAGVYHHPHAIGDAAVQFLVGMIQRNERGVPAVPQTILVEPSWIPGATVRKRPAQRRRTQRVH